MSEASAGHPPLLKRLMQILRGEDASSAAIRESLEEAIEDSERTEPVLSQQEQVMLTNLLAFGGLKVSDVMVPRAQIVAADEEMPLAELVNLFRDSLEVGSELISPDEFLLFVRVHCHDVDSQECLDHRPRQRERSSTPVGIGLEKQQHGSVKVHHQRPVTSDQVFTVAPAATAAVGCRSSVPVR